MTLLPCLALILSLVVAFLRPAPVAGYYRFPALRGDMVVFTAHGDLWTAPLGGGPAQALTTHPAEETRAAISPDGQMVAFSAAYAIGFIFAGRWPQRRRQCNRGDDHPQKQQGRPPVQPFRQRAVEVENGVDPRLHVRAAGHAHAGMDHAAVLL